MKKSIKMSAICVLAIIFLPILFSLLYYVATIEPRPLTAVEKAAIEKDIRENTEITHYTYPCGNAVVYKYKWIRFPKEDPQLVIYQAEEESTMNGYHSQKRYLYPAIEAHWDIMTTIRKIAKKENER